MVFQFQFSKLGLAQPNCSPIHLPPSVQLSSLGQPTQTRSKSPPQLGIMQIPCISQHHNVLLRTPKSHHGVTHHLLVLP